MAPSRTYPGHCTAIGGAGGSQKHESETTQAKALEFPLLRHLSLGNYALGYEDQLAWLTSLRGLQTLMLDNCPIMSVFEVSSGSNGRYPAAKLPAVLREKLDLERTDGRFQFYRSRLSWVKVFDDMRQGMPHLNKFCFTPGNCYQVIVAPLIFLKKQQRKPQFIAHKFRC
ncbi:hypothetical protein NQ176_g1684 [Zarea fungicola]|uniref:Uncharacterized protein n=1 Tax=Zarea fungicola TaxID=93591 RepID=A0ACC1NSE5_9HYPO|nr:hypothetical protein NQ176_g1684 [Lecanicillium fungicola]